MEVFFRYDDNLAKAACHDNHLGSGWLPGSGVPLEWLDDNLGLHLTDVESFGQQDAFSLAGPAVALFYTLLEFRRTLPGFFHVHDLQLLLANMLMNQARAASPKGIALLDWCLLPAAALLADRGLPVCLPSRNDNLARAAKNIASHLKSLIPNVEWLDGPLQSMSGWLVLGNDPPGMAAAMPGLAENLAQSEGGATLCGWDFLGTRANAPERKKWLEARIIGSVLQLPLPRRQNEYRYPAVIGLRPSSPAKIHFAQITRACAGPGSLPQQTCLNLLNGNGEGVASLALEEVAQIPGNILTPAARIQPANKICARGKRLGDYADVLRCQIEREPLSEDWEKEIALGLQSLGDQEDGSHICREVGYSSFQQDTKMVNFMAGQLVRLTLGKHKKYLARDDDIILVFKGSENTIGAAGFLADAPIPVITQRAACIVRPKEGVDPVWLFYTLSTAALRSQICAHASGGRILSVPLGNIRGLTLEAPTSGDIEYANKIHAKIIHLNGKIQNMRRELALARRDVLDELGR